MFKQRSKFKKIILNVILIGSLLLTPLSELGAQGTDVNQGLRNIWDKVEKYVTTALKTSVLSALMNVATMTTQKLAYDAAMYLSAGGSGQQPLFQPRGWKEYGKMLGEQAMGEFIGSLSEPWSELGLNICEPSPLQKLEFQKSFTKDFNVSVPKLQMAGTQPAAPKCDWNKIKSSYKNLAQSVKDFEIDMDISFDLNVNLTQGETMSIGELASNAQQSLNTLSAQLSSLTEKLYGQGIDLSKLWTSPTYIKRMLNAAIDLDEEAISKEDPNYPLDIMDKIFALRKALYNELNKKIDNLQKALNGERQNDKTLKTTLTEPSGDLYFWETFKLEYDVAFEFGNEDNLQEILRKYFLDTNNINKLLRQQVWDRLLIMQMISEKKITNDLIKYVYYEDIDKYVKSSGDSFSNFVSYIQPGNNPSSMGMTLSQQASSTAAKYAQKAQELADNKGFKAVTDVVSGRIKTPADLVQEQYKQTTIKDPSATKQTTLMGAYTNAGVGMALLNTAVNTFTSTVFNNLMNKVYSGLFKPDQMIANDGVSAGLTQAQLAKKLSANINLQMVTVKTEMTDYNVLNEYAICPSEYASNNNCVLNSQFLQALQGDQAMTLREAVDAGLINADWRILPKSHSMNADLDCFEKAFCYENLQKLRHSRIISTAWELVAGLCEDKANLEYCSVNNPFSLKDALDNFYNCGQDTDHPYHILCNLIDPNWILKLPAQKCQSLAYGSSIIDPNIPDRQQYCADDVSCVQEDANGACLSWGYCTREKNVWRFSEAQSCLPEQDSCRSFIDSEGRSFSFLKNTLLLDDFNTCNSENIACTWYSKNKDYDDDTGTWQWQDNFNVKNEAIDRIYLSGQTSTCSANDEGCSKLVRAVPRLGTNLLPNSDFSHFVTKDGKTYCESWEVIKKSSKSLQDSGKVQKHDQGLLLSVESDNGGIRLYKPINIISKKTPRYFIYSATLLIPKLLLNGSEEYNWNNDWRLLVEAYKPGNTTPRNDYIYDILGNFVTNHNIYYEDEDFGEDFQEEDLDITEVAMVQVDLSIRFVTVPDVDRLSVAVLLDGVPTNSLGNQVIIKNIQLEEAGPGQIASSPFQSYASNNLIYLKKAPDYYQCYQNWHQYNEDECLLKNAYWNLFLERCEAPDVCSKFAPYCSIDEVGCTAFLNLKTEEIYSMVVSSDDYCPAICVGYEKLYEVPGQFSDGRFVNLIADSASTCSMSAVGCEEFTAILDDNSLENKYYFTYNRTCQLAGASDCQTVYTWDNPEGFAGTIKSYNLKALNNEPVVTEDDSDFCNEDIYNLGIDSSCYKFYAVQGGEEIDLNDLDSKAHISYHSIDKTVTCSNDCKPYRLNRAVTEDQCLSKGAGLNKFNNGICTVYAILEENSTCSALEVGCQEYRGSRSHSYFTLLKESFERSVSDKIWIGGARIKEAVQKDGYSWQNLGSNTVSVNIDTSINQDQLYLLIFWARRASVGSDKLQISLTGAEQYFTEEGGINLDTRWQQYVLGPVQMEADIENPVLLFSGMNVGNLFLDNVELREINDSYYLIANSWNVSDFCDQIPDTDITVPGYMLGCDAYLDNYGYKHYLKSFTNNCRPEAVGCELVIDTKNNLEGSDYTYNAKSLKEIGNLVLPLIETATDCTDAGYIWERGHCHKTFSDSPINKKQCELWGYYWIGTEESGKCVNDTMSDDVFVSGDKLMTLVVDQNYLCATSANGCSAYGKAVTDADDQVITCELDTVCENVNGCLCRQASTNDYICTVGIGQETCQMDTIYAINDPSKYDSILCSANAKGCDLFTDSQNSIWYFRNPGNRVCEYKELRIDGQSKIGWFKKGTNEPCYKDYKSMFGLWGGDQAWDYYLAGIDDLKNYDFYVGVCSMTANMCTKFIDPVADSSGQRNYYLLDNGGVDQNSCNGQVNLAEGCVLLNNTAKNSLLYSAEKTYAANFQANYQPVAPQVGKIDKSLNPLTNYINPYYAVSGKNALIAGFIRVDLGNGILQNYPYSFLLSMENSSGGVNVLQGLSDLGTGHSGIVLPVGNAGNNDMVILGDVNIPSTNSNVSVKPSTWGEDYANAYKEVLGEMAKQGDEDSFVNNSNTVVKVQRDRACAEWLAPADQEMVYDGNNKSINTIFNFLSCQNMNSGECNKLAPALPPQYLDARLYALRGFGWNTLDYSGYSLPNRYSLADYKQIYVPAEDRLVLALDWKESCVKNSDCDVSGSKCLSGRCYDLTGRQEAKEDTVSCRAYPEVSSPFIYSLDNPILQSEQVNRCYPMTGYCADQFSGTVKDYNLACYSDLDCEPLQRCVFDNKATNDECDCAYTKLTYAELGGVNVYTALNDDKLSNMGLCSGGMNDGLPCFGDNDCLGTQNRTMFRATSTLKIFQNEQANGRCVFPSNAQKLQGWKGFCLEKDKEGQCITWWPVNRLLGDEDIYYKDKTVGLPYLNRYYCLHEDTLYKRLLVGAYAGNNNDTATVCVDDSGSNDKRFEIILNASRIYKTDIYYIRRDQADKGNGYCTQQPSGGVLVPDVPLRTSIVPFYPGAIVRVEGKNNFNFKWHTDENLSIGNSTKVNGPAILDYIKEKWEGQSCFYMLLDITQQYPQLFCNYSDDTYSMDCDDNQISPIVVACSISNQITTDSIVKIEIPLNLGLSNMVNLIKQTYENYENRCVVEWSTVKERTKIHDLFNHICEYQNIRSVDYPLLFNFYATKGIVLWYSPDLRRGIVNDPEVILDPGNQRFSSANIGGTEKICDLMAEVRDEDGNHYAYTDNFTQSSAFNFLAIDGKDYNLNVNNLTKNIYLTDGNTWDDEEEDGSGSSGYLVPNYGNKTVPKGLFSRQFDSFKMLPLIVPRSVVKNKIDLYTQPQAFGAIIGNNLYQPYVVPQEGINIISSLMLEYPDVSKIGAPCYDNKDTCLISYITCQNTEGKMVSCYDRTVKNRHMAKLEFSQSNKLSIDIIRNNNLFLLFNKVFNLLEYKVNLSSSGNNSVSKLFANKVMATYQKFQSMSYNNVKYNDVPLCMNYSPTNHLYEGISPVPTDYGNLLDSIYSGTKNMGKDVYCKGTYDVKFLNNPDYLLFNDGLTPLGIVKPKVYFMDDNDGIYNIYNNQNLNLQFYAMADKNALPVRKVNIDWGDKQSIDLSGFIVNHQSTCDPKDVTEYYKKIGSSETSLNSWKDKSSLMSLTKPEEYGSCSPVCINWPIGSGEQEIKGTICYDSTIGEIVKILGLPAGTTILPSNNEGVVYGRLYQQSLRCYISSNWDENEDDLCLPYFNVTNGKYIDTICESDNTNKIVFNAADFLSVKAQDFALRVFPAGTDAQFNFLKGFMSVFTESNDLNYVSLPVWNSRLLKKTDDRQDARAGYYYIYDVSKKTPINDWFFVVRQHISDSNLMLAGKYQGAAGDSKNCVDKPFSFKHSYQNIVTTNADGEYVCNFGQAIDKDGNVLVNGASNVVYCKLTGKIEIEDNMGKSTVQDFTVMIPTKLMIAPFAFSSVNLYSEENHTSLSNWINSLNLSNGIVVPKFVPSSLPRFAP